MKYIGTYQSRKVYWFDYKNYQGQLPDQDWVCLITADYEPDYDEFERFVRTSVAHNILEFKGHGRYGEMLHDHFDEIVNYMHVVEEHVVIETMTTWHNKQTLADAFWSCFFVTCQTQPIWITSASFAQILTD